MTFSAVLCLSKNQNHRTANKSYEMIMSRGLQSSYYKSMIIFQFSRPLRLKDFEIPNINDGLDFEHFDKVAEIHR